MFDDEISDNETTYSDLNSSAPPAFAPYNAAVALRNIRSNNMVTDAGTVMAAHSRTPVPPVPEFSSSSSVQLEEFKRQRGEEIDDNFPVEEALKKYNRAAGITMERRQLYEKQTSSIEKITKDIRIARSKLTDVDTAATSIGK